MLKSSSAIFGKSCDPGTSSEPRRNGMRELDRPPFALSTTVAFLNSSISYNEGAEGGRGGGGK